MNLSAKWFSEGFRAWITLAPESRPEKIIRKIQKKIFGLDDRTIFIRRAKKEAEKRKDHFRHNDSNRYTLLYISTQDPQKTQKLVLDTFAKLSRDYKNLTLTIVGTIQKDLIEKKYRHLLRKKKILFIDQAERLDEPHYADADFCLTFPKTLEECITLNDALSSGCVTITSKHIYTLEVAEHCADYLFYDAPNELYDIIDTYLRYPELLQQKRRYIAENFCNTWLMSRLSTDTVPKRKEIQKPDKLQFVFISIDIDAIRGTIHLIDRYIDFVESYLIVTSETELSLFKTLTSIHKITVINENTILDEDISTFAQRDHQTKNWILRASLLKIDALQDQFIMLDDDNRPLRDIPMEHFIEDGRYNAYYYYDLCEWHHYTSEYDFGQHNTRRLLKNDGFELLSYSSHKPQIIDKGIFREVVDRYYDAGLKRPIDEWSIYFNYGISNYPYLFTKKKFDVLNWPDHPSRWDWVYLPDYYNFENYYAELYTDGIFKGTSNLTTEEKILLKENELFPYRQTQNFSKALKSYYEKEDAIQGALVFRQNNKSLICRSLPYYCEAAQGSWLKIPISYKALSLHNTRSLQLIYTIDNDISHPTNIQIGSDSYFEGIFYFSIDATALQAGLHTLLIDILIDKEYLYGNNTPYMMKLNIL